MCGIPKSLALLAALFFCSFAAADSDAAEKTSAAGVEERKNIVLDIQRDIDNERYESEPLTFGDLTVLSVSAKPEYRLKAVNYVMIDIFKCRPEDSDEIYSVTFNMEHEIPFVVVNSTYGISVYERHDDDFEEIKELQDVPEHIQRLLPMGFVNGEYFALSGSQPLDPWLSSEESLSESDYETTESCSGDNLSDREEDDESGSDGEYEIDDEM
ncbi:uncharacterized protein BcabD6B2_24560 [Babesia caballi]|uniref:Membrane protein, putative n=1 Tax=Babesia caballi TaxID=5871 RepID=A0AAV4LT43_BABCB|nr:membrane protein, putative [Babesia caballi]